MFRGMNWLSSKEMLHNQLLQVYQSNYHQNEMVVQQNPSQPVSELSTIVNNEVEGLFSPPCIDGY